ncbi:MAG TPA: SIR2 family protein [Pyrinomonadaceae bacterium]|jgi:hypothetical protein|nr:SIR2 family protein [Pyrinomonadaceae bacterium]
MSDLHGDIDWEGLLLTIKYGKCTPFLGAGACHGVLPLGSSVAREWAEKYEYPLDDCNNLARVAQFVAVERGAMRPKYEIKERFGDVKPPDFTDPLEPHGLLADLPMPVYITTNYDNFMVQALRARNKNPRQELCRWNSVIKDHPSVFEEEPDFKPSVEEPIVFHLHGHIEVPESLVLTEDDYLDFLLRISRDQDLIPKRIRRAFTQTSLMFIGYQLADWNFRVIFRSLISYLEISTRASHVSVQLVPLSDQATDGQKAKAREYLDDYYEKLEVDVFWGTGREFVADLRKQWEGSKGGK